MQYANDIASAGHVKVSICYRPALSAVLDSCCPFLLLPSGWELSILSSFIRRPCSWYISVGFNVVTR